MQEGKSELLLCVLGAFSHFISVDDRAFAVPRRPRLSTTGECLSQAFLVVAACHVDVQFQVFSRAHTRKAA